jgi:hypothetical protein
VEFSEVNKTVQTDLFGIVKFQIMTHCFVNDIFLNKTELDCLTLLGCKGKIRQLEFCALATDMKLLGSPTAVANCLARVSRSNLFLKEGGGKKQIFLNPALNIQTEGNIVLNYKFVSLEPTDTLAGSN